MISSYDRIRASISGKEELHKEKHSIPKLIHFIWAGGETPMTLDGIGVVKKWILKNPDCDFILWGDYHP